MTRRMTTTAAAALFALGSLACAASRPAMGASAPPAVSIAGSPALYVASASRRAPAAATGSPATTACALRS